MGLMAVPRSIIARSAFASILEVTFTLHYAIFRHPLRCILSQIILAERGGFEPARLFSVL